jgi:hypothetical protein
MKRLMAEKKHSMWPPANPPTRISPQDALFWGYSASRTHAPYGSSGVPGVQCGWVENEGGEATSRVRSAYKVDFAAHD